MDLRNQIIYSIDAGIFVVVSRVLFGFEIVFRTKEKTGEKTFHTTIQLNPFTNNEYPMKFAIFHTKLYKSFITMRY